MAANTNAKSCEPEGPQDLTQELAQSPRLASSVSERLPNPAAVLSRTDLAALGYPRRAVDAIFRELDVVVLPGFSRPFVRVSDYLELVERSTYRDDRARA